MYPNLDQWERHEDGRRTFCNISREMDFCIFPDANGFRWTILRYGDGHVWESKVTHSTAEEALADLDRYYVRNKAFYLLKDIKEIKTNFSEEEWEQIVKEAA